jgi:hypothetical protein
MNFWLYFGLSGARKDVAQLKEDVSELKSDMREVKAAVTDLSQGHADHEKRITRLEAARI